MKRQSYRLGSPIKKADAPRCARCGRQLWTTNRWVRDSYGWADGLGYVPTHHVDEYGNLYCYNQVRCRERVPTIGLSV